MSRPRAAFASLVLASALLGPGCTRQCKRSTLFLTLGYDETAAPATQVHVLVTVSHTEVQHSVGLDGKDTVTKVSVAEGHAEGTRPHAAGSRLDSVAIDFGGAYPSGKHVDVRLIACSGAGACPASDGSNKLATGEAAADLGGDCTALAITLSGPTPGTTTFDVVERQTPKTDVLFMLDNSPAMGPMLSQISNAFMAFEQVFRDAAQAGSIFDLHVGVVTSDFGAGASGAPGCDASPGGQKGELQPLGRFADPMCQPPGASYLAITFGGPTMGMGMGDSNLPPGQGFIETLRCMASVGAAGCGFEHQLESVYQALQTPGPAANAGFLRDDAQLAVIFLSNEDDSSALPTSDLFDKTQAMLYGYEDSYRSTRYGIVCGSPPAQPPYDSSMGPLSGCVPAPNPDGSPHLLYDVSRYIDFLTKPKTAGGVKADPNDVLLVEIAAPPSPVQVILSNPGTPAGEQYVECAPLDDTQSPPCVPVLLHSCQNPAIQQFFGDPAVRLSAVVSAAPRHLGFSVCDEDYGNALHAVAAQIAQAGIGANCVTEQLTLPLNCTVTERTVAADGSYTSTDLHQCGAGQPTGTCWSIQPNPKCAGASPQGLAITITRGPRNPKPRYTTTTVRCDKLTFPF